ncbi:hypothetical protein SK3146_02270 [Paenibacillus konkukensis]|uniref:Uncharacterized protein n=1 Tax=Paenibacillus konkukensis TaxID=2020716 RepID=A0ABY4RKV0_9BACL|nr:hypothetical protein [Paenibacillus konkukensis]UQZ83109.1 hypothetical protein SK3146_02270 [Paenibacillus konkukensis]
MVQDAVWGIFVANGGGRFPNFFPIAMYTSKEQAIEEINGLPRNVNYHLLRLPVNCNFAYYHKKSGELVGMDGIDHEHYHFKDEER